MANRMAAAKRHPLRSALPRRDIGVPPYSGLTLFAATAAAKDVESHVVCLTGVGQIYFHGGQKIF
jgi:hypothetical protein